MSVLFRFKNMFSSGFLDTEKFHSFREVRSLQWHAHRHNLGQIFLDQFVRQVRYKNQLALLEAIAD